MRARIQLTVDRGVSGVMLPKGSPIGEIEIPATVELEDLVLAVQTGSVEIVPVDEAPWLPKVPREGQHAAVSGGDGPGTTTKKKARSKKRAG